MGHLKTVLTTTVVVLVALALSPLVRGFASNKGIL